MSGNLPGPILAAVQAALAAVGDATPIRAVTALGGGSIHRACRLETGQGRYFLKWNPGAASMFAAEARGLALLAAAAGAPVRVPGVIAHGEPGFLLEEYLEGRPGPRAWEDLGEALAALHRASHLFAGGYGLDADNFIGAAPQINGWMDDWVEFFIQRRLRPQLAWAGYPAERVEPCLLRARALLGAVEHTPALLHGDLWSGNVIPAGDGLALIDPAAYYGDREAEIAFTRMFGGFPPAFYEAYQSAWPLAPGFAQRAAVYNLYHALNHLNLFGEAYRGMVERVLES